MSNMPGQIMPPDVDGPEGDYSERIFVEQLRRLARYLPAILGVNLLVGAALVYALWNIVPRNLLAIWAISLAVLLMLRATIHLLYRNADDPRSAKTHTRFIVVGSALSGALWGAAGVILFPDNLEYQLFIITMLVGMGAGAVSSLTAYMPAFYAYLPTSVLPVTFNLFYIGGSLRFSLGIMLLTYIVALSFFARTINRSLTQTLRLGFQNRELISNLLEAKERAEHASLAKTKFVASASHDLRQPLQALGIFVDLLDARIKYPDVRQIVDNIKLSTNSLISLLNSILDISKLDAGIIEPKKKHFHIEQIFEHLAEEFRPQANKKGLTFRVRLQDAFVYSDPVILARILRNLLANSVRYTEAGGVLLANRKRNGHIRIDIYDTGIGIEEGALGKIFEEFYQVENPERDRSKGIGLGLAIVRRLVELLGHAMQVYSRPGAGSVFSIMVPAAAAAGPADTVSVNNSRDIENACIVVIDDESIIREGISQLLKSWHYRPVVAESAADALQQLADRNLQVDMIIADYRLREGKTGVEAVHDVIAQQGKKVPAIIVTGDIEPQRLREAQASGFHLLHKPVAPATLRNLISTLIVSS